MEAHSDAREKVADHFDPEKLHAAQTRSWEVFERVKKRIRPGMTEKDALAILKEEYADAEKIWHPPQIRFGINTLKAFGKPSEPNVVLQENDVYFLDFGPVYDGYEGDVGATVAVGSDPELQNLADSSKRLFEIVRKRWKETKETGQVLYDFAEIEAKKLGYTLSLEGASGHRVSEFPHAVHFRGKLRTFEKQPSPDRWILEIHLFHPSRNVGSFFEDIL